MAGCPVGIVRCLSAAGRAPCTSRTHVFLLRIHAAGISDGSRIYPLVRRYMPVSPAERGGVAPEPVSDAIEKGSVKEHGRRAAIKPPGTLAQWIPVPPRVVLLYPQKPLARMVNLRSPADLRGLTT